MSSLTNMTLVTRGVLEKGGGLLAAFCWLAIAVLTLVDVAGRYLFSSPLFGSFEMVQGLMAIGLFLSMPVVALNRGMVVVELVIQKFPDGYRSALQIITGFVGACFFALIAYALFLLTKGALHAGEVTTLLRLPHWIIGAFLCVFSGVTAGCCLISGFHEPELSENQEMTYE